MAIHRIVIVLIALAIAAGSLSTATAQEKPAAEPGVLAQATVEALPAPGAEVWFLRIVLDPGGSLPPDVQIGPTLAAAESGAVTLSADRSLAVYRDGPAAEPEMVEGDVVLEPGDFALAADGTTLSARNDGTEPASMLNLLIIDPQRESTGGQEESTAAEPVGATTQAISIGAGAFDGGPAMLTIERVTVQPDVALPVGVAGGMETGGIEEGSLRLDFASGEGWIWRGIMTTDTGDESTSGPEPEMLEAGSAVTLEPNDGYAFAGAAAIWQAEGDSPATVLRAVVAPLAQETGTPSG